MSVPMPSTHRAPCASNFIISPFLVIRSSVTAPNNAIDIIHLHGNTNSQHFRVLTTISLCTAVTVPNVNKMLLGY